jgi:hypothetical protein
VSTPVPQSVQVPLAVVPVEQNSLLEADEQHHMAKMDVDEEDAGANMNGLEAKFLSAEKAIASSEQDSATQCENHKRDLAALLNEKQLRANAAKTDSDQEGARIKAVQSMIDAISNEIKAHQFLIANLTDQVSEFHVIENDTPNSVQGRKDTATQLLDMIKRLQQRSSKQEIEMLQSAAALPENQAHAPVIQNTIDNLNSLKEILMLSIKFFSGLKPKFNPI